MVEDLAEEEAEQLQVEMLLETYFMHLDHLYERLQDMKENIEATAVCPLFSSCHYCLMMDEPTALCPLFASYW